MALFATVTTVVVLSFAFVGILAKIIDGINENIERDSTSR